MNGVDSIEILKNDTKSNARDWFRETSIISYGVVTDIVAEGIVTVTSLVRDGAAIKTMTVPLVATGGALLEEAADPTIGDLVLLLFVDKADPSMFDSASSRFKATGDWSIFNTFASGYNKFSAVGMLIRPFKGVAATMARFSTDDHGNPTYVFKTTATVRKIFRREFNLMFDSLPKSSGVVDRLVQVTFGKNSPYLVNHWAAVTRMYGFMVLPDTTLAAVSAPVVEKFSQYAPVTREYDGTLAETFKGNVTMTFTGATWTITGDHSFSATFQGPITLNTTTADKLTFGNSVGTLGATNDQFWAAVVTFCTSVVSGAGSPAAVTAAATALNTALATLRAKMTNIFV
jgi:hypothetical protein